MGTNTDDLLTMAPHLFRKQAAGTPLVPVVSIDALLDRVQVVLGEAAIRDSRHIRDQAMAVRGHQWELQAAVRQLNKLIRQYDKKNNGHSKV